MLKNGTKKILLVMIVLIGILVAYTSSAYAININITPNTNTTVNQTTDANTIQQINGITPINNTVNTTTPVVSNNTINNVKPNTNVSTYTNTDLPKTGVEDYPIVILMAACVIAAIYAYIKVRNYNNL